MSGNHAHVNQSRSYRYFMALAALGVVYGDIGTSPLYALKESFHHGHNISLTPDNIFGILSLIFWSLMIVITYKYIFFILRADNKGEGGIFALTSLIGPPKDGTGKRRRTYLILLGIFGTALLYGDGMITPAISVLSAVEGLKLITPVFEPYIVPITIAILLGLFSMQKHGTGTVGKIFGPITLLWFFVLGSLGVTHIIQSPEILYAVNPLYAFHFFVNNAWNSFIVLGSVFLVITGGEALYSDLGHFGKGPIRLAWFYVVLPGLLLNYFGQGALLLNHPEAAENPFFLMAPSWSLYPLVILATISTVIASQALITGVFSLTMQAVQHGYMPRVLIEHTSENEFGQIYVKSMNHFLMAGCIALVVAFKTSSNLAAAYGLAVTTTMVVTTILFYVVAKENWNWNPLKASLICGFFLIIDLAFFGANLLKIFDGGWVPLGVGIAIFIYMTTWKTGRKILAERIREKVVPLKEFLTKIKNENAHRVESVAIYMNGSLQDAPHSLVHGYLHYQSVHRHLVFLSVVIEEKPQLSMKDRLEIQELDENVYSVKIHYGYMERPDIPKELEGLKLGSLSLDPHKATYFIGKENIIATTRHGMAIWREKLFSFQARNALAATTFFQIPKRQVVELGVQIDL